MTVQADQACMMWLRLLVLANLFIIPMAWSTTFQAIPFEKLISASDVIVVADFLGSRTVELEEGLIATESRFRLEKETGLNARDQGFNEILVYHPGGFLKSKGTQVEGAPKFVIGEKNVLLLKNLDDGRLWVQGLAMGTFKMVRLGEQTLLINPIFPDHHALSMIQIEIFQRKVTEIKGESLKSVVSDKYVLELEKARQFKPIQPLSGKSRSIASVRSHSDNKGEPNVMDSFWLIIMLSTLGVLAAWRTRRSSK